MNDIDEAELDIAQLARSVRARVPVDAARLLADEAPERVRAVLALLPASRAKRIRTHMRQNRAEEPAEETDAAPGTVAELMEAPLGAVALDATVADAIAYLRLHEQADEIVYLWVVTTAGKLVGLVVIRDLLLASEDTSMRSLMLRQPFRLRAADALEAALSDALHRHYPVYPVVDEEDRLVGVARGWELFEWHKVEISAQSGRMVGVQMEERVTTPLMRSFVLRHPWLQLNLLTAFLAAFVVTMFEDTIAQIVVLAAFLPVLAGQSGNNGSQTLAITLRGITLGDIADISLPRLLRKEVLLGAMNGALTGAVAALAMWWSALESPTSAGQPLVLAGVILLAMTGACMASGFFGVAVPLLLRRCGTDPATASSIFLTTGTDVVGMGLMLGLATLVLL